MPSDPDWSLFDELPEDVPMIVVDDSGGRLARPPRANVRVYDETAQRAVMGSHYAAIPHKSAATRNFGHYLAYREGFDVVIALDYDCRLRPGWLDAHIGALGERTDAAALRGSWINTISHEGWYARGFPYELRNAVDGVSEPATATGNVRLNMGVWDGVVDINGVDKLIRHAPTTAGNEGENVVALGHLPICGMNTAFAAELVPAYFFLPDVWVDGGWQLSRHDDIWGGYVLESLMRLRGDLISFGSPVVEHTRQSTIERVVSMEHYMSLLNRHFFELVDDSVGDVVVGPYADMFGDFADRFAKEAAVRPLPTHYRAVFCELAEAMQRWAACFR